MADTAAYTADDLENDPHNSLSDLVLRVSTIYNTVTDDYFSWSYSDSQQAISSLSKPSRRPPPLQKQGGLPDTITPAENLALTEFFDVTDFDYDKSTRQRTPATKTYPASSPLFKLDPTFRPYPPYTYCAPASRNVFKGDDSHYMPFIPFSDDETYNYALDIELYNYFAWQKPGLNPDEQVIALETVLRLISDLGLRAEEIDEMRLFPIPCQSILSLVRKRDFPKWPPLATNLKSFIPQDTSAHDPDSIIAFFLNDFCTNLNCLIPFCNSHEEDDVRAQVPDQVPPKFPPIKVSDMATAPCGQDCFLLPPSTSNAIASFWSETDIKMLSATLRYAPDTLPCDLAIICRKPCREIYRHQLKHPVPLPVFPKGHRASAKLRTITLTFLCRVYRAVTKVPAPLRPTASVSAMMRTVVLDAVVQKLVPEDKAVPVQSQISCVEPDIALASKHIWNVTPKFACFAKRNPGPSGCRNVGIQRGDFKRTEVKESKYGLGLYVMESCKRDDLISEYVGEIICDETVVSRDLHARHKGRSYVFSLNKTFSLDSAYVGNETRYINHSNTPNCSTKVRLVNGEHRIGVYASRRIAEGEELFIDYGPTFWQPLKQAGDVNAPSQDREGDPDIVLLPPPNYVYDDPKDLTYEP